jgi:hypothetical protein
MAEGLWACDSGVELGLAQRAEEDPVGFVQSSDMVLLWQKGGICMYVCLFVWSARHYQTSESCGQRVDKSGEDGFLGAGGAPELGGWTQQVNKRGKGAPAGFELSSTYVHK